MVWQQSLNRNGAIRGAGSNKLRTYRLFKAEFGRERYLHLRLPLHYRSALAKFRCGVAPLRLETGRYENVPLHERFCFNCDNCIESESHVLFECPLYESIRKELISKCKEIFPDFEQFPMENKVRIALANDVIIKYSAKTCYNILKQRKTLLYCK